VKLDFAAVALDEIGDIRDWYEASVPDLGWVFLGELSLTLERVRNFPAVAPVVLKGGIRRVQLNKFPYAVFYQVDAVEERVVVLACMHARRAWKRVVASRLN
jgi:hypothetical protein